MPSWRTTDHFILFLVLFYPFKLLLFKVASQENQTVKNLPAVQETQIGSLGQEDPLEKGKATHSGILAWRVP